MKKTLRELGKIVKDMPAYKKRYRGKLDKIDDKEVGLMYLKQHPHQRHQIEDAPPITALDKLKVVFETESHSPSFTSTLHRLGTSPVYTDKGFFESNTEFYQNVGVQMANRAAAIRNVEYAAVATEAIRHGMTVEAYLHEKGLAHSLHLQKELLTHQYQLEKHKDNDALDVGNREILTPQEVIDILEAKLMTLIDRFDTETHPTKKRALEIRINRLMEELDGRPTSAAIPPPNRERVESSDEGPVSPGSSGTEAQEDVEPVSIKGFRMGE